MDGKVLAHAIAHTRGDDLRIIYALLFKVNAFDLVTAKTKEIFNKRIDHFSYAIKDEVKKLDKVDDGELQLQLIANLSKLLQLDGVVYDSIEQVEWQCDRIIHATHDLLTKEEPEYVAFRNASDEMLYESIVHYQMQKLFVAFEEKFQHFNDHDSLAFTNELIQIIQKQPDRVQQQIVEQLQLKGLHGEGLLAKMREEGTVLTCSTIIEFTGFSGYAHITSAIATTMTITGIALPFGVYTFGAALLSVVLNPMFLVPILVGSGGLLMASQTKTLQKKLLPMGILQLMLPVLSDKMRSVGTPNFELLLQAWDTHAKRYLAYDDERLTQLDVQRQLENNIKGIQATIHDYTTQHAIEVKERQAVYQFIREEIFNIPLNEQSTLYRQLVQDYIQIEQQLVDLKAQQSKNKEQSGFWNTITATIDNTKIASTVRMQTKELDHVADAIVNEVISSQPALLIDPIVKFNGLDFECKRLKDALENEQYNLQLEKEKLASTVQVIKLLEKQMKSMEKALHGLQASMQKPAIEE